MNKTIILCFIIIALLLIYIVFSKNFIHNSITQNKINEIISNINPTINGSSSIWSIINPASINI
jgi:hypothetical protein